MNRETFGGYIRKLREDSQMPLRKLAAHLDIDQSTLSKMETNQRQVTKEMIPIIAKVFRVDVKQLKVKYLSEKILYEIQDEEHGLDALKVAEQSFTYSKQRKK